MCMCRNSMCSSFEVFLHVHWAWTWSIWRSGSFPHPSLPLSTVYSVWWVPVSLSCMRVHGWVAWELAANSGSPWMFEAPNLHIVMQLLKRNEDDSLLFPACSNNNNPLTVLRPCNIFNSTTQRLVFIFQYMLCLCGVPDSEFSRDILKKKKKEFIDYKETRSCC